MRFDSKRWSCTTTILVLLALAVISAPSNGDELEATTLRILAYDNQPFFYRNADGSPTGFEYTILSSYADARELEVEIEWTGSFSDLLPRLIAGEADLVAASMTRTAEREKSVDFSESYLPVKVVLVEPRGTTSASPADLEGKRLATIRGTTYEKILAEIPGVQFEYVELHPDMFTAVAAGKADALACDSATVLWILNDHPDMAITLALSPREHYGFALQKQSSFKASLNAHIDTMKADGSYREALRAAFGDKGAAYVDSIE